MIPAGDTPPARPPACDPARPPVSHLGQRFPAITRRGRPHRLRNAPPTATLPRYTASGNSALSDGSGVGSRGEGWELPAVTPTVDRMRWIGRTATRSVYPGHTSARGAGHDSHDGDICVLRISAPRNKTMRKLMRRLCYNFSVTVHCTVVLLQCRDGLQHFMQS